jgi:hypothetical protein
LDGARDYHKKLQDSEVESKIVVLKNSPHGAAMLGNESPLFSEEYAILVKELRQFLKIL